MEWKTFRQGRIKNDAKLMFNFQIWKTSLILIIIVWNVTQLMILYIRLSRVFVLQQINV